MGALIRDLDTAVGAISQLIQVMTDRNAYTSFLLFGTRPKVAPLRCSRRGIIAPSQHFLTAVGTYWPWHLTAVVSPYER